MNRPLKILNLLPTCYTTINNNNNLNKKKISNLLIKKKNSLNIALIFLQNYQRGEGGKGIHFFQRLKTLPLDLEKKLWSVFREIPSWNTSVSYFCCADPHKGYGNGQAHVSGSWLWAVGISHEHATRNAHTRTRDPVVGPCTYTSRMYIWLGYL